MNPLETLADYISRQREKGKSDEEIKNVLLAAGWNEQMVNNALLNDMDAPPLPPTSTKIEQESSAITNTTMWDAFKHILMFITMGVFVVSMTLTFHVFVDRWLPKNPLQLQGFYGSNAYQYSYMSSMLKGYTAAIIVSFPLFAYLFLNIQKSTLKNPEIKKLKSRKILTYLTLIVSFLFILGNLTNLVYKFLDGDAGINFLSHIAVTLSVSGVIFGYFLRQVRDDKR